MYKLKSYIASFLLLLFLFPTIEKVAHEFMHAHDNDCHVKEMHYCSSDHDCPICDFSFSAFTSNHFQPIEDSNPQIAALFSVSVDTKKARAINSFFLRGPPHFG